MAQPESSGNSLRDRFRSRLGLGSAPAATAPPSAELPGYRTGSGMRGAAFQQTPTPTNPSFRGAAPAATSSSGGLRAIARGLGRSTTPLAAAAFSALEAADEARETGDPWRAVGRAGIRTAGATAGATLGGLGAGALGIESGPGALIAAGAGQLAGGYAGYEGGKYLADRFLPRKQNFSGVQGGFRSTEDVRTKPSVQLIEPGSNIMPPTVNAQSPQERQRAFDERARERMLNPPRDQVSAGDAPDPFTLRTRTQGAVIENPHAMSAMDQLSFAAKRFKGSPSMRQAAAEMIMGGEQRKDANRQAELNANMTADATMAQGNAENQRLFADRKLKAQITNANLDEEARQADQTAQVQREGHLLGAGSRGIRRMGDGDAFSDQIFKAALKDYGPEGAARMAAYMGNLSGEVGENPYDRYAQSADMIGTSEGIRRYNDRWLGFGNKDFDVTTAKPESTAGGIRGALTPGVRAGDVRYVDAKGNRQWGDAASLPQGQSVESFSLQREMQRRRREAAGME